ncbi:oxidoreductase [Streptococcus criceti]|uniref:Oxidoreductase, short chain dehydrogenase/reductase family protein n=1 Tax=Streptococcus criceti HS-6 TaxID=873449 RepID=G5JR54_STRCG|nr:SDR family oxidoreductase [Streptococcus criceti]EHI73595.1 oxidoreductase, short chain dehydrogenase/reductase family protein [Streptococcus criceti HS-6]SUN42972.1 oxidoreductase [Streptococcus criceti]
MTQKRQRVIAITGASGGLAEAIIKLLPQEDMVVAIGRNKEKMDRLYADRVNFQAYSLNSRDDQAVAKLVDRLYADFTKIDVFINNAGFGEFKNFDQFDAGTIRETFDVNTLAAINFSRLVGEKMAQTGSGHIINIASMAGKMATAKFSIYAATKFALIGYSNALRLELADSHVYVTTVNPGPISTKFFDRADPSGNYLKAVGRFSLTPEQVAKKIVASMEKNKRELNMPFAMVLAAKFYALFPKTADFLSRKAFNYK